MRTLALSTAYRVLFLMEVLMKFGGVLISSEAKLQRSRDLVASLHGALQPTSFQARAPI